MKQRFDREFEEQRARAQYEQRLDGWFATLEAPSSTAGLAALREGLAALRAEAADGRDARALARLDAAEQQIAQWERTAPALAAAEALVMEAEQLAGDTTIDDALLPARWDGPPQRGRISGDTSTTTASRISPPSPSIRATGFFSRGEPRWTRPTQENAPKQYATKLSAGRRFTSGRSTIRI
jgi:hypothetical protein